MQMDMYEKIMRNMEGLGLFFQSKPIIIGGLAMEYYGLRRCGDYMDFVITNDDYETTLAMFFEEQKDVWGDLGFRIKDYELFRSISLFDYEFYLQGAVELEDFYVLSLDKLLFTRVLAMKNEKHKEDLRLIQFYYYETFRNQEYYKNAQQSYDLYCSVKDGIIFGGKYDWVE